MLSDKNLMKKKSSSALHAVSPVLQGLVLQGASPMCFVCALLLSLVLLLLQSICLQRLSLPVVGSVWSPIGMGVHFNKVCSGLLAKGDLPPLEVRSCKV